MALTRDQKIDAGLIVVGGIAGLIAAGSGAGLAYRRLKRMTNGE